MGTHRLLLSVVLLFELGVLFLTQSRGALFGLGVAFVVVAVAQDRRWAWVGGMALGAGLAATAIIGLQPALDLVVGGLGGSTVQSAAGRLELFSRALYMLEDFSFTGVGLGMFPKVLSLLYPLFLVGPDTEIPHAHNILLQAGVDHGIPGLVAFLALLIVLGYLGVEAIQESRGRPWQPLAIGLLAGLIAYLAHGQVDAYGYTPRAHILVWGHFGLLTAVWKWTRLRATARDE
jgi:putative inorganic carbon (HCO3(-)) transporter